MFNTSKIIRKLMIDCDISVTPLARKIGITQQNLSRKLNNVNESYTLEYLENIVNGMGCHIHKKYYTVSPIQNNAPYYYIGVKSCIIASTI